MNDFLKGSSFKVLLIAVVVLLGLIIYTATAGGSLVSSILGFATTPMQSIATEVTGNVTEFLDLDGFSKEELKDLVVRLQNENGQLLDRLVDYDAAIQENQRLKQQLNISQEAPEIECAPPLSLPETPTTCSMAFPLTWAPWPE